MKKWRLTVRDKMASAHALRCYNGKCENLHGHNFGIEMVVEGHILEENVEILIDFTILKNMLKETLSKLDHRVINEIEPFVEAVNPSSENIAQYLWGELEKRLDSYPNVQLYAVTVAETEKQCVTFMQE
ncbi:MAG: 6-pyruvoyl trahydropterin synthase family protein [Desulfovibrionaceae bacterium]